jgi:hypothetical protein
LCQQAIHLHWDTPTKGAAPHHPHQIHHVCVSWPCTLNNRHRNYFLALPTPTVSLPQSNHPRPCLAPLPPHCCFSQFVKARTNPWAADRLRSCSLRTIAADRGQSALMSQNSVCAYARKAAGVQGSTVWAYGVHTGNTHVRRFVDAPGPRPACMCK